MVKHYDEWNQQDRRRVIPRGKKLIFTPCNSPEYQKSMRDMRRQGFPKDLAHKAALQTGKRWPLSVMGSWQ